MTTPSLLHYFAAPDQFYGRFGWLCGYSADCNFLDQAAERFTRQTAAQRAHQGQLSLAVMLDPAHPVIALTDAPGVAHVLFKSELDKPFALLHAKVAVLGFRHETKPDHWLVRLIVSTGNWTVQTVTESLDLVTCIECSSEDLTQKPSWLLQNCTDISAAWNMLNWLRGYFDTRLLYAKPSHQTISLTAQSMQWLEAWLDTIARHGVADARPRYFDNRKESLLSQLAPLVKHHASGVKRRYLAMGSGFFEGASGNGKLPSVLGGITSTLQQAGLLTVHPTIDVFVNPSACQAVAQGLAAMRDAGYSVRPAWQNTEMFGSTTSRTLHAKFIFSATSRGDSARCSSFWVYLGSGNLTGPGFANPMSAAAGNLEAGMLLSPVGLYWCAQRDVSENRIVSNLLPVQWSTEITSLEPLSAGEPMPEHQAYSVAPPVAWLCWQAADNGGSLRAPEHVEPEISVLDVDGLPCVSSGVGVWQWRGPTPRVATIQWSVQNQLQRAVLPVLDESGRIAATDMPPLDLDEVWWHLANFPLPAVDEDKTLDELEEQGIGVGSAGAVSAVDVGRRDYPIRRMMALIEQIAAKQVDLHPTDWLAWCTRLEQSLLQIAKDPVVDMFRAMRLNPLSPLRESAFVPVYAEDASSAEGYLYRALLTRVEEAWGVATLCKFGAQP